MGKLSLAHTSINFVMVIRTKLQKASEPLRNSGIIMINNKNNQATRSSFRSRTDITATREESLCAFQEHPSCRRCPRCFQIVNDRVHRSLFQALSVLERKIPNIKVLHAQPTPSPQPFSKNIFYTQPKRMMEMKTLHSQKRIFQFLPSVIVDHPVHAGSNAH